MRCKKCRKINISIDHGWIINGENNDPCNPKKIDKIPGAWTRNANRERDHYSDDIIQPIKNGKINERFIKAHGTKELQKQWKMTDKEIRENIR